MSEQNGALMRRWFEEVWNRRREDAIDEMMADDVVASGLTAEPIRSRDAFKQFYHPFIAAFPDIHVSVEDVLTDGDRVAFRCHLTATHLNGRKVEFDGG